MDKDQASMEFSEHTRSQLPALHLLQNLGYTYLSPREALALRGGRADAVLLEGVLLDWLAKHNEIQYHDQRYPFSEGNIHAAIQVLKETLAIGLLRTNETIFDLLSLGKSLQQSINGNLKSFQPALYRLGTSRKQCLPCGGRVCGGTPRQS